MIKMKTLSLLAFTSVLVLVSCKNVENDYDASGAFESVETIISTEASGTIIQFNVEEGMTLKPAQFLGYIDTVQLDLRKQQLEAQINATASQTPDIPVQVASLGVQLKEAEVNRKRIENLVKAGAGTQKDLDDINSQIEVIRKQIDAQTSTLGIASTTISKDITPMKRQIAQIEDQLSKCRIINPVHGTVLTKYAQAHEIAMPGKALYKIAETDTLILRAYITGVQLPSVKIGQKVKVRVDEGTNKYKTYDGEIYWISDKSEFTPKTIRTREERADLVYAVKVRVANDGFLKIGMYGEMKLMN